MKRKKLTKICLALLLSWGGAAGSLHAQTVSEGEIAQKTTSVRESARRSYLESIQLQTSQQYEEAARLMEQALAGFASVKDTVNTAAALRYLGDINMRLGNSEAAMAHFHEAVAMARRSGRDELLMSALVDLRNGYRETGNMEAYTTIGLSVDSLVKLTGDKETIRESFLQKGTAAQETGDYKMAEYYFDLYKKFSEQAEEPNRSYLLSIYFTHMRDLKAATGDYEAALRLGEQRIEADKRQTNLSNFMRYLPYISQANIYVALNDSARAMACLDSLHRATESGEASFRERFWTYTSRGLIYKKLNRYDLALKDYEEAERILAPHVGPTDDLWLSNLGNRAGAEYQLGKLEASRESYAQYAEAKKQRYGETSNEYSEALYYLANIEAFCGRIDEGCAHYVQSAEIFKANTREQLRFITGMERETYWKGIASRLQAMSAFAIKSGNTESTFTESCYDAHLFSKALLLETEKSLYKALQEQGTAEDRKNFATMEALLSKQKELSKDFQKNKEAVAELYDEIRRLDQTLTKNSRTYGDYTAFLNVRYRDIRDRLGKKELLVDFTDYFSDQKKQQYAAYLIRPGREHPLLLATFTQESVDSLLDGRPVDVLSQKDPAAAAQKLLWDAIAPYAEAGSTIYYVPSGFLYRIALETIPMSDGRLLGERHRFVRLSSARELKNGKTAIEGERTATLYGGLQYDLDASAMVAESRKYNLSPLLAMRGGDLRGDSVFTPLPQTREEIKAIETILETGRFSVTPYSGSQGTEESFLSMDGRSPKILHIATHGFYYTPDEAKSSNYLSGYTDAMSLSGLVLAGANAAWRGDSLPDGVLGGILTAHNIARLDLSATDLVVLSACQTGQGQATAEGLFGLQRAFKKAGVGTMVVTLWRVSDLVTREFMTLFYEELARNKWNKRKAFDKARGAIREKYPEPFYWSAFVMVD